MAAGLRTWFVRDLMQAIERRDASALTRLSMRLPERLTRHIDGESLRRSRPTDSLPLDDGEELLLAVDAALGDGSGKVIEQAAQELTTRLLLKSTSAVIAGDLHATMARLRTSVERPFLNVEVAYELERTPASLSLSVGVAGRPRATRIVRHLVTGTLRAAHRFCREGDDDSLRVYAETVADRANITLPLRTQSSANLSEVPSPQGPPPSRRPSRPMRAVNPLSDEVERIMSKAGLTKNPSPIPQSVPPSVPRRPSSSSLRTVRPPYIEHPEEAPPPPSAATTTAPPGPPIDEDE